MERVAAHEHRQGAEDRDGEQPAPGDPGRRDAAKARGPEQPAHEEGDEPQQEQDEGPLVRLAVDGGHPVDARRSASCSPQASEDDATAAR